MEKEDSQAWIQELIWAAGSIDQQPVEDFLRAHPYTASVRILQAFRKVHEGLVSEDQAREDLALFAPWTFSFPFVYARWESSLKSSVDTEKQSGDNGTAPVETREPLSDDSGNTQSAKPTKYHDDIMPFSFLWWLNKTRIEFSETYQPYSKPMPAKESQAPSGDWIDQQIKENIFHMQSPEKLLSDSSEQKTISYALNEKVDPIIEKFIKEEPQIKPPSATEINLENKARQSAEDESGFVSETLATIYAEQGLYVKAIETYKKLSLKFPEKSPYFAKLIEKLNKKIN